MNSEAPVCPSAGRLLSWAKLLQHLLIPYKHVVRMKMFSRLAFLGSLFLVCGLLHAQDGCVSSPECPTAVLGLVGAAGAALYAKLRSR